MSREGELFKNTIIITIGNIATKLISFFLLPLYTALLTTKEYGVVELLNTLVSLCIPIFTLQLDQAIFRYLIDNRENKENIKKGISTALKFIIIASILFLVLFFAFSSLVNNEYKYFLATNVVASIFSSMFLQISRGLGDNKVYAEGSFITAATTVILNVIFIAGLKWGANGMLSASLIGNIICSIYIFFRKRIYKYIEFKDFSKDLLKKLLKYSIPLIPNSIAWWIFNSSDRIIVTSFLGLESTGILSAAYKFSNAYIMVYNIFNMTWTESAALHINDEDNAEYFNKIINTVFNLFTSICVILIAFMPMIFKIMVNEKFDEAYNQIPILLLSTIFNVLVGLLSVIYIAKKDTKAIAETSLVAALINAVVNLLLIKFIGLYAASVSTLVAYAVLGINRYFDVRKKYMKVSLNLKVTILTTIMIAIVFLAYYLKNNIFIVVSMIISIIYALFINKNSFGFIKKLLMTKLKKNKNLA